MKKTLLFCLCPLLFSLSAEAFHPARQYPLAGQERWDYLLTDSTEHRIYITRGNRVSILDTQNGQLLDEIKDLQGVHGVALAKDFGLGFVSDGKANAVVEFDMKDFKKIATIPVGINPDSIIYDSFSKKVFAFDGKSKEVSVINPQTHKLEGQLKLKGKPEFSVSDQKSFIYVNIEDSNEVVKINSKDLKIENTYSLKPCEEPAGLSMNLKTGNLFVGCGNKMLVVFSPTEGKVLHTIKVGEDADATAYDPLLQTLFASTSEGTLEVIKLDEKDQVVKSETLKTKKGSHTMAVDSSKGEVYVVEANFKQPAPGSAPKTRPTMEEGSCTLNVFKN